MSTTNPNQTKLTTFDEQNSEQTPENQSSERRLLADGNRKGADGSTSEYCQRCGAAVTDRYVAVFGAGDGVEACPECSKWPEIVNGGAAVGVEQPGAPQLADSMQRNSGD